ncbi:hypothetical protein DACRYDRAFT_111195 [Dacryopinax primogenitus]|uniref:SET domain-containing protein n=1 Tax=Dacryopinax primogenitus (strain DJM 731) TaxID=1858805 RepID=M5G397_DACPD|nr:uncharacterized protein DACRYDRAFT_111195 [Dacryopinax primogenitus]EJT98222.1 hypothetical protein DACRYDRAFT_111195 [Dacryopinax primogenitus]
MPAPVAASHGRNKPSHTPPPNWPVTVPYLPHPIPHASLSSQLVGRYCTPAPLPVTHQGPITKITKITDPAHPAFGQYGLFAAKKIPPKTWILDYTGVVHDQSGTDLTSNYDLCLELLPRAPGLIGACQLASKRGQGEAPDESDTPAYWDIAVDAAKSGNAARFINDFRGVPSKVKPNVEFQSRKIDVSTTKGRIEVVRIGVWSGKDGVAKGEELLLSYGRAFWRARRKEEEEASQEES